MDNQAIEDANKQKTEDYLYFTSEEYIDKIAKQNLGLINPGEEVIILSPEVLNDDKEPVDVGSTDFAKYTGMSNPQKWWVFFFGD